MTLRDNWMTTFTHESTQSVLTTSRYDNTSAYSQYDMTLMQFLHGAFMITDNEISSLLSVPAGQPLGFGNSPIAPLVRPFVPKRQHWRSQHSFFVSPASRVYARFGELRLKEGLPQFFNDLDYSPEPEYYNDRPRLFLDAGE